MIFNEEFINVNAEFMMKQTWSGAVSPAAAAAPSNRHYSREASSSFDIIRIIVITH